MNITETFRSLQRQYGFTPAECAQQQQYLALLLKTQPLISVHSFCMRQANFRGDIAFDAANPAKMLSECALVLLLRQRRQLKYYPEYHRVY